MPDPTTLDPFHIDLRAVSDTLRGGRTTDVWMRSWLPSTWASPERFTEALYAAMGVRRGAVFKSRATEGHDLYHECVSAHLGKRRTALIGREGLGWERVTYESLHARCNALAAAWTDAGVEAGMGVAILLPPGIDLAVALFASFRLGLVASVVPPLGPTFVKKSLAKLGVELVATSGKHGLLPTGMALRPLPITAGSRVTGPAGSFTYGVDEIAAKLLTPFGTIDEGVAEVPASVMLDGAVRDATTVYALDASDVVATPGFDPIQHEPAMLLTTLVAGATMAFVTEADLVTEPALLKQLGVTLLGVHRKVRETLITSKSGLPASTRAWFRSLTDILEPERWDLFSRTVPDRKQPGFGVVTTATTGGVALFSPPTFDVPSLRVWPGAGLSWQLSSPAAGDLPSIVDSGVFTILRGDAGDPSAAQAVIGRWGEGYAYAGSLDIGPDSRPYPSAEIEEVVTLLDEVHHAAAFSIPGQWVNDARVVLLLFVESPSGSIARSKSRSGQPPSHGSKRPRTVPSSVELHAVKSIITREMGARFLPDRIEVVPLRPRFVKGTVEVDRAWCRSQYLTGTLRRKGRDEMFRLIGRLGYMFAAPSTRR